MSIQDSLRGADETAQLTRDIRAAQLAAYNAVVGALKETPGTTVKSNRDPDLGLEVNGVWLSAIHEGFTLTPIRAPGRSHSNFLYRRDWSGEILVTVYLGRVARRAQVSTFRSKNGTFTPDQIQAIAQAILRSVNGQNAEGRRLYENAKSRASLKGGSPYLNLQSQVDKTPGASVEVSDDGKTVTLTLRGLTVEQAQRLMTYYPREGEL